jgi:hypothetical protein
MAKNNVKNSAKNARITPEDLENGALEDPVETEASEAGEEAAVDDSPAPEETSVTPVARVKSVPAQAKESRVDIELRGRARTTKEILDRQPKVRFMIPLDMGEKKGSYHEVQINGYVLHIQKGVFVDLPKTVADLLAESMDLTNEAGSEFRIDRDEKYMDALS